MEILTLETTEKFVRASTTWIASVIAEELTKKEHVSIGLCGGSTPKPVYTMLATDQHLAWERVTFFLLDERYVPADHPDSNQRMIRETLLTRNAASATCIAPDTSLSLSECVKNYEDKIMPLSSPDLVIIGMGEDGHITSLFPPVSPEAFGPTKVIHTQTDLFAVKDRISTTFPILLQSTKRLFLITGEKKKALLQKMQREAEDVSLYPAQYLFDERSTWIVGP